MPVTQYDDVNLSLIPANATNVAAYVDGRFANVAQARKQFPKAHILTIATRATSDADCLDDEPFDATNTQAPAWYKRQRQLKPHVKPVLYTSAGNVAALVAVMTAAGVARDDYLVWSAHFTGTQHICGPKTCGFPQADGTQWTDHALDRSLDQSLLSDEFVKALTPPKPAPVPTPKPDTKSATVTYHLKTGAWDIRRL